MSASTGVRPKFCTGCGVKLPEQGDVCPNCGRPIMGSVAPITAPVAQFCTHCGTQVIEGTPTCPSCGAAIPSKRSVTVNLNLDVNRIKAAGFAPWLAVGSLAVIIAAFLPWWGMNISAGSVVPGANGSFGFGPPIEAKIVLILVALALALPHYVKTNLQPRQIREWSIALVGGVTGAYLAAVITISSVQGLIGDFSSVVGGLAQASGTNMGLGLGTDFGVYLMAIGVLLWMVGLFLQTRTSA